MAKNRYPLIAALAVAIIAGIIVAIATGFFSCIWEKLSGTDKNTFSLYANSYFNPTIEFNIFAESLPYPFAYEIEEDDKWDAFLKRGKELIDNDSSDFAIDFLIQMQNQYNSNALFYHIMSIAYQNNGQFNLALEYVNRSIEIDDRREWAFLLRSSIFNFQENIEKAIDDIKIGVYLNRKNPYVWIMYGITVLKKWDVHAAEEFADSALHYNTDPFPYYDLKRLINIVAKNYELALVYDDSLESVRSWKINNPHEFESKARIYASNNRNVEALIFIDSCLYLDNEYVEAWTLKSLFYFGGKTPNLE